MSLLSRADANPKIVPWLYFDRGTGGADHLPRVDERLSGPGILAMTWRPASLLRQHEIANRDSTGCSLPGIMSPRVLIIDIVHCVVIESYLRTPRDPWITVESATVPGSETELTLSKRDDDFAIRVSGVPGDLMNSRTQHCAEALAEFACTSLGKLENARILIGGLGMGFTLAAALRVVPASAAVVVAQRVPDVVEWNRGLLGQCAGRLIEDARTSVHLGDVADLLKHQAQKYDAILLDVANGPEAMTSSSNEWLCSREGLNTIYERLRPEGIVAIWSARTDQLFTIRLRKTGFNVQLRTVRAPPGEGSRHTKFVVQKR